MLARRLLTKRVVNSLGRYLGRAIATQSTPSSSLDSFFDSPSSYVSAPNPNMFIISNHVLDVAATEAPLVPMVTGTHGLVFGQTMGQFVITAPPPFPLYDPHSPYAPESLQLDSVLRKRKKKMNKHKLKKRRRKERYSTRKSTKS